MRISDWSSDVCSSDLGWNFRGVFKRDREGNLLDADGKIVSPDDPEKWRRKGEGKFVPVGTNPGKSVHLMDIHAEKGLQCADCHFAQDSHGNGFIRSEEHTSELQSLMRLSYAVFCLTKKNQ